MIPPKEPFDSLDLKYMLRGVERSFDDSRTDLEIAVALGIIPTAMVTGTEQPEITDCNTDRSPESNIST